ncbi:hypothetical protein OY671_012336, partial [Metschnikowia pulcherrima]
EGIRGAGVVCGHSSGGCVGCLLRNLSAHACSPQGAAHLRLQSVLHGLYPGRGHPAHRQQSRRAGVARTRQKLFGLLGCPGCDDAMVVRPQRRRFLPDLRLPGHDVLLHAGPRRTADLFLPPVHHQFLGHHLHVHVGGFASSALYGVAALGS